MRMRIVLLLGFVAGCGVYSVRVSPPPRSALAPAAAPLDLSVSLGDLRLYRDGDEIPLDEETAGAIDAEFVRAATASGLVREALPRGSRTDLYCDVVREVFAAPMDASRTAYLLLLGPAAAVGPGFPYPWDYRITRTVRLRGEVKGTTIPLREQRATYRSRVWGASYWGGLGHDPGRQREGEYLVAALADAMDRRPALFARFASAARAGDVELAWLLGVEATQDGSPSW